jgi:hypothetical protein
MLAQCVIIAFAKLKKFLSIYVILRWFENLLEQLSKTLNHIRYYGETLCTRLQARVASNHRLRQVAHGRHCLRLSISFNRIVKTIFTVFLLFSY